LSREEFSETSGLSGTRPPAVAGIFYSSDPEELRGTVRVLLEDARRRKEEELATARSQRRHPLAVIAPHAGYMYSGQVAATAYAYLELAAGHIDSVAVIGPSHRVPLKGLALSSAKFFKMPGFRLSADEEAIEELRRKGLAEFADAAHAAEHSIEVHFPFIWDVLGPVRVVAIAAGEASAEEVGCAVETLLQNSRRVVVVSSDLSHYLDYESAVRVDTATIQAILDLRYEAIGYDHACGRTAIRGILWCARQNGMRPEVLDLRNSGDTAGPRESVVGYPAVAFWPNS